MLCFKYAAQQMIKQGLGGVLIGEARLQAVHFLNSCLSWNVEHLYFSSQRPRLSIQRKVRLRGRIVNSKS